MMTSPVTSRLALLAARATAVALGVAIAAALVAGVPFRAHAEVRTQAPARAAEGPGPALWVVSDADSTLYLFGTVHVLRPDTAWGSPRVDAAFDSASEVWFELSNPDDQAAITPLMAQYGVSPQTPLSSLLTPAELADLDAAARTIGANAAQMDPLRPWLAGLTLSLAPLVKAGYDPHSGVETVLQARAKAAGKPVRGLETIDQQVRVLASLSEKDQLDFLRATLHDFDEATTKLDEMVAAWAGGDVEALDRVVVEDMAEDSATIYQVLLIDRNLDWADQIQGLLEGSGTTFIAVGAAHLAGGDSVQAILQGRGVTVTRVE